MTSLLTEDCSRFLPLQQKTLGRRLFGDVSVVRQDPLTMQNANVVDLEDRRHVVDCQTDMLVRDHSDTETQVLPAWTIVAGSQCRRWSRGMNAEVITTPKTCTRTTAKSVKLKVNRWLSVQRTRTTIILSLNNNRVNVVSIFLGLGIVDSSALISGAGANGHQQALKMPARIVHDVLLQISAELCKHCDEWMAAKMHRRSYSKWLRITTHECICIDKYLHMRLAILLLNEWTDSGGGDNDNDDDDNKTVHNFRDSIYYTENIRQTECWVCIRDVCQCSPYCVNWYFLSPEIKRLYVKTTGFVLLGLRLI